MEREVVIEVIAFIVGGLVLTWGLRSAAFAFSGGEQSGRHEVGGPSMGSSGGSEEAPEADAPVAAKSARTQRFHQAVNYALSLAAMGALVAMLVGAWLA